MAMWQRPLEDKRACAKDRQSRKACKALPPLTDAKLSMTKAQGERAVRELAASLARGSCSPNEPLVTHRRPSPDGQGGCLPVMVCSRLTSAKQFYILVPKRNKKLLMSTWTLLKAPSSFLIKSKEKMLLGAT